MVTIALGKLLNMLQLFELCKWACKKITHMQMNIFSNNRLQ